MLSDEKKIKEVLDAGKEILFSRPELAAKHDKRMKVCPTEKSKKGNLKSEDLL